MADEKKVPLADDEIAVKKDELKTLLKRVEDLEKGVVGGAIDLEEPTVRTVRVRLLDGKPVSHLEKVERTGKFDKRGDEVLEATAFVLGKDGKLTEEIVDYVEFLRSAPEEECIVLEAKATKRVVVNGSPIEVTSVEGYKTLGSGVKVKQTVTYMDYVYKLQRPDGSEITVLTPNL